MSDSIICATNVSKIVEVKDKPLTILSQIDLQIFAGETVAIVGPSGAGKSTLLTLLAGLDTPTKGEIHLLGHPISTMDDEQRASIRRDKTGFVFQQFLLIPTLTVLENVTLPYLLQDQQPDIARATALLTKVGLADRLDHLPSQLSGGEQQRVALVRAFMNSPAVLFADEPTGNLDSRTANQVQDELFKLNQEHQTTLIIVTHDFKLAKRCQKQIEISDGLCQIREGK